MLTIDNLSYSFGPITVLKNLSMKLAAGEIVTLIGTSGSGKTTLFKVLTGILPLQQGTLTIAGTTTPQAYSHVAYMMQEDLLLSWRTVLGNLMLVGELGNEKRNKIEMRQEAMSYLAEVGLEGWEDAYPDELSGGMRQRVSLARALLQKRPVILLDEPFAALDLRLREQMHTLLHDIRRRHGTTLLMVTHDFRDALALSDRIFFLSNGQITQEWIVDASHRKHPQKFHELHEEMRAVIRG